MPVSISLSILIARDLSYCNPDGVMRVARSFPDLTIIVSPACWPFVDQAIGVALACANAYLSLDYYVTMRTPGHESYVQAANSLLGDRLLFGSAYPRRTAVARGFRALALAALPSGRSRKGHVR